MRARQIESTVQREILDGGCLLCSEERRTTATAASSRNISKEHLLDVEIEHIP
jgi:hypothetical protein